MTSLLLPVDDKLAYLSAAFCALGVGGWWAFLKQYPKGVDIDLSLFPLSDRFKRKWRASQPIGFTGCITTGGSLFLAHWLQHLFPTAANIITATGMSLFAIGGILLWMIGDDEVLDSLKPKRYRSTYSAAPSQLPHEDGT